MRGLAILGALVMAMAASTSAAASVALSDAELDGVRGGITTPFGIDVGLGATMRTFVDGQLVLETQLTWTDQGSQALNVAGAGMPGPRPGSFVLTLPSPTGGATQIEHDLSDRLIASVVLNTASGRTIRQDTDVTLVIPQLASLQKQMAVA
ncbi:MAG TPA: hypothetical protein VGH86_17055, partial [Phenylobacterium sp.]